MILTFLKKKKKKKKSCFKNQDFKGALLKYHFAWLNIKGLGDSASSLMGASDAQSGLGVEEKETVKALTENLHLNLAACYLKTEQLTKCVSACTSALAVNNKSAKAYFRRGQAHLKLRNVDGAEKDLREAAQLAPSDVAIRKELQKVVEEKKRQAAKQAKTFKGFFDKVELYDDKEQHAEKRAREDGGGGGGVADDDADLASSEAKKDDTSKNASTQPKASNEHSDPNKMD